MLATHQQENLRILQEALNSQEPRPCNLMDGSIEREDRCFNYLTELYFFDQKEFENIFQALSSWLNKPANELSWALRGYFSYLKEDYKDAASSFIEAIVRSPENFDNWIDYAFTLRHLGYDEASLKIIFETRDVMNVIIKGPIKTRKDRLKRNLKI